jgi:hypothetical protein
MIYIGQHIWDEKTSESWMICHVNHQRQLIAIADMNQAEKAANIRKPEIMSLNAVTTLIKKKSVKTAQYPFPAEFSYSDKVLTNLGRKKWIEKRDEKYRSITPLTTEQKVVQYLYGDGLAEEVEELRQENLTQNSDHPWKTKGAYYNALNRYIVLGCTVNALLPYRLKNTGSNYFLPAVPGANNIKRGRGGSDNGNSRSKSMGITQVQKDNLKALVAYIKSEKHKDEFPKFSFKKTIEMYQRLFECTVVERDIDGVINKTYIPFEESDCLSEDQLRYHLKKIIDKTLYLQIKYGHIAYEKDHADRQGSARDGVIGATYRYETDATVLDIYVRYPFDTTERYTMGRPILYIVVDVFSTMIPGFYVGFDGPNWTGQSQALVNACSDKVEFAARYGVEITEADWPCHHIPVQISVDNGHEHPDGVVNSVLSAEIGVRAYNFMAAFRGDAKGTVEGTFNCLYNQVLHFTAGAIPEAAPRGEQHQSNKAVWDYDTLMAFLIREIIYHNNSADRLKRFDINAVRNNIDITPQALYLHSLKQEMNGGRDGRKEEQGRIHWAFLPEEEATVREDGIYFNGLVYYSDFAKQARWFTKAKHDKAFKIPVKRPRDWTSSIWHKSVDGQYVRFDLKNANDESPFIATHWEPVLHLLEQFKDKKQANKLNAKKLRLYKEGLQAKLLEYNQSQLDSAPKNTRISIQPGIKGRQATFKALEKLIHAIELHEELMDESRLADVPERINEHDDLDNEMNS